MKSLIALSLIIAAAMTVAAVPLPGSSSDPRFEPSFDSARTIVVAQRRCPNGIC